MLLAGLLQAALAPGAARAQGPTAYNLLPDQAAEYTLVAQVKGAKGWTESSEVRLAFDAHSEADLAYVRVWGRRAGLYRVTAGKAEAVGQPRPVEPPAEWTPCLQRRAGRVRLVALGRVILDEAWPAAAEGSAGTWASPDVQVIEPLLQPWETPQIADDFTREVTDLGGWQPRLGDWRNSMVTAPRADPTQCANPFNFRANGAPLALATTGYWFWDSYRVSVSVRPATAQTIGLAAWVQDPENLLWLRWTAGAADAAKARQLVLRRDGKDTVLAAAAGGFVPEQWYRLELVVQPGAIQALIDRAPVLSCATDGLGQGEVGLVCADGEAAFDDLAVGNAQAPLERAPKINPVFLADGTMTQTQVYTPAGQWRPVVGGVAWNWGFYPQGVRAELGVGHLTAPLTLLLHGDGSTTANAYAVTLQRNGAEVQASLIGPGTRAASGTAAVADVDVCAVETTGDTVRVTCGGREVLTFRDPEPLPGRLLGLVGANTDHLGNLQVTAPGFLDYAFDAAPTDWFSSKGLWQVTTRWPCQPGWTFFGGTHDENPVLWTKHAYAGDQVLEFFANLPMDCPPPPGYSRPSDIDAALCGDGVDLGSGYALIFAGWRNTKSAILRKGQIVAETAEAVLVNPTSANFEFHRHWFRVRAEKLGNRVALSVDGREILSYADPDPLPGGRAGVFSFHNGLMVGRARLWFEEEQPGGVVPGRLVGSPPPAAAARTENAPTANDFESDTGEWQTFSNPPSVELALDAGTRAAGQRSLRLRNLISGGSLGVYATTTPFRLTDAHRLSFDYRLPPGVAVNAYIYAGRQWHAIRLSAEEPAVGGPPVLGAIEGVACDDAWHHATFDLLPPLAALHPDLPVISVKYIAFAAPEESYVRCGIGANRRGATFWMDNFRVEP